MEKVIKEKTDVPDEIPNSETLSAFTEIEEMKKTGAGQRFGNLTELWVSLEA